MPDTSSYREQLTTGSSRLFYLSSLLTEGWTQEEIGNYSKWVLDYE